MNDVAAEISDFSQEQWEELISKMNYGQLRDAREAITLRMKDMRNSGITQLRATIAEQAQILGVDLKDLIPKARRKYKRRKQKGDDPANDNPEEN